MPDQGAGDQNPLLLPAGEIVPLRVQNRIDSFGKVENEIRLRVVKRLYNLFFAEIAIKENVSRTDMLNRRSF